MDEGFSTTGRRVVGYALRWGQPAIIRERGRTFEEAFARGAFAKSIAAGRVRLCLEHQFRSIVARQSDGTLRLVEDHVGLLVDALAGDTEDGDAALYAVRGRGKAGLSVGFDHGAVSSWSTDDGLGVRRVTEATLREVSICRNPAYASSEVHAGRLRIDRFFEESERANRAARLAESEARVRSG